MAFPRCASSRSLRLTAVLLSAALAAPAFAAEVAKPASAPSSVEAGKVALKSIPLVFEENAGQLPVGTLFTGRAQGYAVQVKASSLSFAMAGKKVSRTIDLKFAGAAAAQPSGMTEAGFKTNYYVGSDPKNWHAGVRNFDRIALRGLYPGIDAEFYSHNGEIEHDFLLAPNADSSALSMQLSGAREVRFAANGDLLLDAEDGYLRLHKPVAYQLTADGKREPVEASFHLVNHENESGVSFGLGSYDHARQLVIDPVITYATYVAGTAGSIPAGIAADAAGNVYLTGSTASPSASFAAVATSGSSDPAAGQTTAFVAKLAASASGSQIAWLSYYGSATLSATATSIAINPAATTVYIGGSSPAGDLPVSTGAYNTAPTANGSGYGFVSSFATGNGHFAAGTYVEATSSSLTALSTTVTALAATAAGVTIAGNTTGHDLAVTTNALPVPAAVQTNTLLSKGYVLTLNTSLKTPGYCTYVAGDLSATGKDTLLSSVVVDSTGNIYVAGLTFGNFPKSGVYTTSGRFGPPATAGDNNGFAAQLVPGGASTTIGYSYWTGGTGNDSATGITLDAAGALYVVGNTTSANIVTSAATDSTYSPTATILTPLNNAYPAGVTAAGYFSELDKKGGLAVTSYLTSSTPGSTSTVTGVAVDAAENLYLSGSTDGTKAAFPSQTSGTPVGAPVLPGSPFPQDLTTDSAAPPFIGRGYLLQMAPTITSVTGLSYLGSASPSGGTLSSALGVVLDTASTPNAYVLVQDKPKSGATSFTLASAAQQTPLVADGATSSAYVAQIAPGASSLAVLVGGTNTASPTVAEYVGPLIYTTETFTWKLTGAHGGATSVVFNLPYSANLQAYSLSNLKINGVAATASQCTLGTSSVANAQPGLTCLLGTIAEAATDTITFSDGVSSAVTVLSSVSIPAAAYDAQGGSVDLTQTFGITLAPTLTLTNSVSPSTVNAATSQTDTSTPNSKITYTYVIKNTSSVDSPTTKLTTNLGTVTNGLLALATTSVYSSPAAAPCDPTTASGCDLQGGQTLTYTVIGEYVGTQFGANTVGPYPVKTTPSVSYADILSNLFSASGSQNSVSVLGNAYVAVNISNSATTYNGGFQLGDSNILVKVTLANSGPNEADAISITPTLPNGFVATSLISTSGACVLATTTCSSVTVAGNNGTTVITATGSFSDTGTNSDAVLPPATSPTPGPGTVSTNSPTAQVTAQVSPGNLTSTSSGATIGFNTITATNPTKFNVSRVNNLGLTLSAVASLASNTVNETNTTHVSDSVTYKAVLSNTGPSVARGLYFSFPLPVSSTGTTATVSNVAVATSVPSINAANQLQCSAGASAITCYEADLVTTSTGAPPVTPAALTYTVSFAATFPETTIPLTTVSGKATVAQSGGTFYASSVGFNAGAPFAANPTTVTVQRSTNVIQTLVFAPSIHAPAGYADTSDLNLDEHVAGNAPGVNDSLVVTASTYNAGLNDAAGVSATISIPPYLLILTALPSTCSINGVAAPVYPFNTGATGVTLTCAPLSSTTPAGTAAGQLSAAGTPCTTNSGACVYFTFTAKFVDAPSAATIVGNGTKAVVTPASAVATGNNVDVGTGLTSTPSSPFGVQRAAHLLETLAVAPQVHAPSTFFDKTDINLDEHVANNAAGVNDQLIVTSSTSNTGVNYALNVLVTVPLPSYLELFSLPTGCVITGSTATVPTAAAPYTTSASGGSLTCVIPPAVAPATSNSVLQYAGTCAAATNAQCLYLNFLAKFVDAPTSATIVGNNSTATVTPAAATVAGTFSDSNTGQAPNTPAPFNVQRAAHLRLASGNPITPTYTDNSALTLDGTTPMIGQAAKGANALTRAATGVNIYNCIRYTVSVVNEGPNYTNSPTLNYDITQAPFTAALKTVGTAPAQGPVNCTIGGAFGGTTAPAAAQTLPIGSVMYNNGTQTIELDGYFGLNVLSGANSATSAFQTSAFTTLDYQDSDTTGTAAKDYLGAKTVEIVNTPINNAAVGGFTLTPTGATPAVTLIFSSVTSPGITSSAVSTAALSASSAGGILPSGKSPYPPDNSAVKKLYQSGKTPVLYTVPTTAIAPTATTNPTSVCIAQAGGLPDLFVKPERSLLWALQNVPAGTVYNAMPTSLTITPTASAPATGDVTVSVVPNGATQYVAVPPTITFPESPQAQPSQLCGQVNGFTASTATPTTFAVLEPVNFAPYVVAATTSVSAQTGKGSTSSLTDIFLQVSSTQTHDFNDKDPCYPQRRPQFVRRQPLPLRLPLRRRKHRDDSFAATGLQPAGGAELQQRRIVPQR